MTSPNQPSLNPRPSTAPVSPGSDLTTSAVPPPLRKVLPPTLLSAATSISTAPSSNRTVAAIPLKLRNLSLRSSDRFELIPSLHTLPWSASVRPSVPLEKLPSPSSCGERSVKQLVLPLNRENGTPNKS